MQHAACSMQQTAYRLTRCSLLCLGSFAPQKTRQATTMPWWSDIEAYYESALTVWTGLTGGRGYPCVLWFGRCWWTELFEDNRLFALERGAAPGS